MRKAWETVSKQKTTELGRAENGVGQHLHLAQAEDLGVNDPVPPQQNV